MGKRTMDRVTAERLKEAKLNLARFIDYKQQQFQ